MKKPIFSIKKLHFLHKKDKILNINKFDLHRGTMYLFSGSMGSGKSTLMKILAKNKNIDSNQLFYEKEDINKISSSKYYKDVVFLDQTNKKPWLGGLVKNYITYIVKCIDNFYKKKIK